MRPALVDWLSTRHLSETFEVQRLRWTSRDTDPDQRWLALELRFIPEGTEPEREVARFGTALERFEEAYHASLAESLFFKLVHAAAIPRSDARVTVAVLTETFAVVREPDSGRLRFEPTSERGVRLSVSLPGAGDTTLAPALATVPRSIQPSSLPGQVQRYLQDFFARKNSAARRPAPEFTLRPLESDYVGLDVAGIRQVVITGSDYWESLQISVQLTETAQGRNAVCYLDGGYAPGLGSRLPGRESYTDFFNKHQSDLERFANELMSGLQEHLARGGR